MNGSTSTSSYFPILSGLGNPACHVALGASHCAPAFHTLVCISDFELLCTSCCSIDDHCCPQTTATPRPLKDSVTRWILSRRGSARCRTTSTASILVSSWTKGSSARERPQRLPTRYPQPFYPCMCLTGRLYAHSECCTVLSVTGSFLR